jgi:hypothetical protein
MPPVSATYPGSPSGVRVMVTNNEQEYDSLDEARVAAAVSMKETGKGSVTCVCTIYNDHGIVVV